MVNKPQEKYLAMESATSLFMNMLVWCGCYLFLLLCKQKNMQEWEGMCWIPVYYFLFFLLRRFVKIPVLRLIVMTVLYVPVAFYVHFEPHMVGEKALFFIVMVTVLNGASLQYWKLQMKYWVYIPKWYCPATVTVFYLYGVICNNKQMKTLGLVMTMAFLLIHMWGLYIGRLNEYLQKSKQLKNVPQTSIFGRNSFVVIVILGIMLLLMLFSSLFQYDGMLQVLLQQVMRVIKRIAAYIHGIVIWMKQFNHPTNPITTSNPKPEQKVMEDSNGGNDTILAVLGLLSVLFVIGVFVREVVKKLKKILAKQTLEMDVVENIAEDILPAVKGESIFNQFKKRIFRDNREKVRYYFKRRVKKNLKNSISSNETAQMLCQRVRRQGKDEIGNLTALYEVARYSNREITQEEIRICRKKDAGQKESEA